MSIWFGITNNSGYGTAAPGQVVSIDSPLAANSTCTSPINHWNCSMSGPTGACTGNNAYIVTGSCTTAWGQLDGTTGSTIIMSAYDTSGANIFSFNVNASSGSVTNIKTTYTFPSTGATVTYGCSSKPGSNPWGNTGYLFTVYVLSVSIPTNVTFINKTNTPLSINYPTSGLSNWSGAINNGTYQVNAGMSATGQDNGFIALATSGVQLAGYTSSEIYSYLAKFSPNQAPAISPGPGSPTAQAQYTCLSSYEAGTNTYTITMISTPTPITWDASSPVLKGNGQPTVVHGLALSSMEYLLGGIGMKSFATYAYGSKSIDFTQPSLTEMDAIFNNLPFGPGVIPSVRIALNASYYLGMATPTSKWRANAATFPNSVSFSTQYQTLLDNMITYFTARGVVCILDLHWNDEITEQRPMALNTTTKGPTGDSLAFLKAISMKYGANSLVWYELYNEPYLQTSEYTLYRDGGISADGTETYYGMKTLYNAVRANTNNPIVIAGSSDYAYNATSLIQFQKDVNPTNVLYNFHPYMGGPQGSEKNPAAFEALVTSMIANVGKPIILTEAGQYCCVSNGACSSYTGSYNGSNMGYLEAILQIAKKYNLSWTVWGWIPNTTGTCSPINANNDDVLMTCPAGQACGANYAILVPKYGVIGPQASKNR